MEFRLNQKKIEHLFSVDAEMQSMGYYPEVSMGARVTSTVTGGKVWGPALSGDVIPGSNEASVLVFNGVMEITGSLSIKTESGALVYLPYKGRSKVCQQEDRQAVIDSKDAKDTPFYVFVEPETSFPELKWLNVTAVFAVGRWDNAMDPKKVQYDFYSYETV